MPELKVWYATVLDIVDWTVKELVSMDRKTTKILPINGCLHARSKIARLYQFSAKLKDDQNLPVAENRKGKGNLGYRKPRSRSRICLRI